MNPRVVKNWTHPIKGLIFTCQMMRNLTKLGQPFVKHWQAMHARVNFSGWVG